MYAAEVALAVVVLFNLQRAAQSLPPYLLACLMLWIVAAVCSALAVVAAPDLALKGIARAVIFAVDAIAISFLVAQKTGRLVSLWLGVAIGGLVKTQIQPHEYQVLDSWKFGYGFPLTLLAVLLASRSTKPILQQAVLGLTAGFNFYQGFRSLALFCLVTAFLSFIATRWNRSPQNQRITQRRLFIGLAPAALISAWAVRQYDQLALTGFFGDSAQVKANFQSVGNFGSLLGGRTEFVISATDIALNPLFGIGSYASPSREAVVSAAQYYSTQGFQQISANLLTNQDTSYHSRLLGLWAENGILAAPLWLAILVLAARGFLSAAKSVTELPVIVLCLFTAVNVAWDVLFSPFGGQDRFILSLQIATILLIVSPAKKTASEKI